MTDKEILLLKKFKSLLEQHVRLFSLTVFGSRARGDADENSDLDVLVVIEEPESYSRLQAVSDCAWEAELGSGVVISPVVFSRQRWENSPERDSLLAMAVRQEGIPV
jgi:predicted nucleotidyltransferase